jgi:aspartyl-tRNA(Asn)/glutamyl-tRNA(Gln) amidotransferase subunit A
MGERIDDPLAMYLCDAFTVPASLAGIPAVSVPCGLTDDGLPVGMQFMGPARADALVLRAARAMEKSRKCGPVLSPVAADME